MAENKVLQGSNRENRGLQGPQLNIEDNRGYRDWSVRPGIIIMYVEMQAQSQTRKGTKCQENQSGSFKKLDERKVEIDPTPSESKIRFNKRIVL